MAFNDFLLWRLPYAPYCICLITFLHITPFPRAFPRSRQLCDLSGDCVGELGAVWQSYTRASGPLI